MWGPARHCDTAHVARLVLVSFDAEPLDRRREPRYQGPWQLPGPDSHRLATLNLTLGLHHINLLDDERPELLDAHFLRKTWGAQDVVFLFMPDLLVVGERTGSHLTRRFVRTGEQVLFSISIPIRSSSQESASAEALSCESAVSTPVLEESPSRSCYSRQARARLNTPTKPSQEPPNQFPGQGTPTPIENRLIWRPFRTSRSMHDSFST